MGDWVSTPWLAFVSVLNVNLNIFSSYKVLEPVFTCCMCVYIYIFGIIQFLAVEQKFNYVVNRNIFISYASAMDEVWNDIVRLDRQNLKHDVACGDKSEFEANFNCYEVEFHFNFMRRLSEIG